MNKKQIILAAMMMFAATSLTYAQYFFPALANISPDQKERLEKNYAVALSSENKGLVESALAMVSMIKLDMPAVEFPTVWAKIEELKSLSATPSIRYKAFLASAVFSDPAMFKQVVELHYNDANAFFGALDKQSSQTILSEK